MPSFFHSPRSWKPRRWLFQVHLYAGITIGLLTLVIGLSGAALVYSPELELGPRWASAPVAQALPLDELSKRVLSGYPGSRLQDIRFNTAGDAVHFHVQGNGSQKSDLHLVVDPATGAVTKAVDRRAGAWHFLRKLHHDLLAEKTGRKVNGVAGAVLFVLCATGIVIWWPGPKLWKKRVQIQRGTGWKRVNWDLHNTAGFWTAAALAFFAFSGFEYAFPFGAKRPEKPASAVSKRITSLDALAAQARAAVPGAELRQMKLPKKPTEPVEARLKISFDGHEEGNTRVFLDRGSATILRVERLSELPAATRAVEAMRALHTGRFFSPGWMSVAARLVWVAIGLAPGLLFVTGFLMWWNRVAAKKTAGMAWLPGTIRARQVARAAGVLAAVLLCAWKLSAQEAEVAGRVVDLSGAAVADAKVTLRTSPERVARTDAQGKFVFANVGPGRHGVTVEAPGFAGQDLEAVSGARVEVKLDVAPVVETVTVNAGTVDQLRLEEPVALAAIGRADIATRNNRRLSDVVARMPGVFLTGPPGGDKDVRVRGLDKEYTRTQVDGVMIPDGGEKRELQLNRIPSSVVESVRLIRNPTAEFESDGLAGRIDVQTRPPADSLHIDGRLGYGARQNGENGLTQGQFSAGSRLSRHLGFFAGYNFLDDNLPIGRDKLLANRNVESEGERQHQRSGNFFGDVGLYTERLGELHLKPVVMGFVTNMSKLKTSANGAGTLLTRQDEAEDKSQQTRGLSLNHRYARASGLIWDTQGGWFRSTEDKDKLAQAYKVAGGAATADKRTIEPEDKSDRTLTFASAASLPVSLGLWHDLKFGTSLRYRGRQRDKNKIEIDTAGKEKYVGEAKDRYRLNEDYQAAFVQDRVRFTDRLSLTPGVRIERVRLTSATPVSESAPRHFVDVNPSAHLLYRVSDRMSLRAAASRGLARPKFDELSPFENVSSTKIVIGNPDLNPTRAWNYDVGAEFATRGVTFAVTGFRKTLRGVIEEVDTGLRRGNVYVYQVQNVGNGWLRGLEFEQRFRMPSAAPRWSKAFSFWSNQTFLASRLRAANGQVRPFKEQPSWIANFGLDFSDEKLGTSMALISNFLSRRYDYKASGDVTAQGGATTFDVAVYQRVRGNWRVFVEANNLTNRGRVQDEMFVNGTVNRRLETYGRTVLSGIQFGF